MASGKMNVLLTGSMTTFLLIVVGLQMVCPLPTPLAESLSNASLTSSSTSLHITNSNTSTTPEALNSNQPVHYAGGFRISKCTLAPVEHVRDKLEEFLEQNAKLVKINIRLEDYPVDFLNARLKGVFMPHHWIRSSGRQGRSLLILEDNYDFMSLFILSMGVFEMSVGLADSPSGCLKSLSAEDTATAIRELLLNDFKSRDEEQDESHQVQKQVCNKYVKDNKGYAQFMYTCCHVTPEDYLQCEDTSSDVWLDVLLAFVWITKIIVLLYSPLFIPDSFYLSKFAFTQYTYFIPETSTFTRPRVVFTKSPEKYFKSSQDKSKVVLMSSLKKMEGFRQEIRRATLFFDRVYELNIEGKAIMKVLPRQLLDENNVPVGLQKLLANNFLRCRIRHTSSLKTCCNTPVFGRSVKLCRFTWYKFAQWLARLIIMVMLILPWVVRVWMFYAYEDEWETEKQKIAKELNLKTYFRGTFATFLTPFHGIFIFIYSIMALDILLYGVLSEAMVGKLKLVFWSCLRNMRKRSYSALCQHTVKRLVRPLENPGILNCLFFVPYICISLVFITPMAIFYLLPAFNVSGHLILHFVRYIYKGKALESEVPSSAETEVRVVIEEKTTVRKTCDVWLEFFIVIISFISFWSIAFFFMEVTSFFVEMAMYTLMGIIVNESTLQYVTVLFLVVMYGRSTLNDVYKTYLTYHNTLHGMLLEMAPEDINTLSLKTIDVQQNTILRVQGDKAPVTTKPDLTLTVQDGVLSWKTTSMLLFMDKKDTLFTPEWFFYDSINLQYGGAPGPIHAKFVEACWSFGKILLFLFFVFVVVMAFGDAYRISSTNQLLATVAGGFIPFVFSYVFTTDSSGPSLEPDNMLFKTHLHALINDYCQVWPVYDFFAFTPNKKKMTEYHCTKSLESWGCCCRRIAHWLKWLLFLDDQNGENAEDPSHHRKRIAHQDTMVSMRENEPLHGKVEPINAVIEPSNADTAPLISGPLDRIDPKSNVMESEVEDRDVIPLKPGAEYNILVTEPTFEISKDLDKQSLHSHPTETEEHPDSSRVPFKLSMGDDLNLSGVENKDVQLNPTFTDSDINSGNENTPIGVMVDVTSANKVTSFEEKRFIELSDDISADLDFIIDVNEHRVDTRSAADKVKTV